MDPFLAREVSNTIEEFCARKDPIDPTITHNVELTTGFQLRGTPGGSPAYALEYFNKQVTEVWANVSALNNGIIDLQTHLHIFTQCTIQKLPRLLGADIMYNLPEDFLEGDNNWWD